MFDDFDIPGVFPRNCPAPGKSITWEPTSIILLLTADHNLSDFFVFANDGYQEIPDR